MERMGPRLRELRDKHFLSRKAVADELGTSERIIYGWEKDEYKPSRAHVRALAKLYKVSPSYIESGASDEPAPDIRELLEQHTTLLTQIDQRIGDLWKYVQSMQHAQLPVEQLEALARLERYTESLERMLQESQRPPSRSGTGSGAQRGAP
jgi:transcriptional regulator with XRE-family HTH domain